MTHKPQLINDDFQKNVYRLYFTLFRSETVLYRLLKNI